MADRVIVTGVRRARQRIPVGEVRQMVGRAGRSHDGSEFAAHIIVEESDYDFEDNYLSGEQLSVSSSLSSVEAMAFHILPEICYGKVVGLDAAMSWHARSLGGFQGRSVDFDKVFVYLRQTGAIEWDGVRVRPRAVGEVSSSFYFHPADVAAWMANFTKVFDHGLEGEDMAACWALGNVPMMRFSGDFGNRWPTVQMCRDKMPIGLDIESGRLISTTLWWHVMGGPPVGKMKNVAMSLRDDFGRIRMALVALDHRQAKWDMVDYFDALEVRVRKRIPSSHVELCRLRGITKNRAAYLYNRGVRCLDDILESAESIISDVDEPFADTIREIVDVVSGKGD